MNLNHLALFLAVAEEGGVSRGAERLHISQPAVSKQLAEFESALGMRLFERLPRGIRLTEAGGLLLVHARRLFAAEADAERMLGELKGLERGRLSIGASTTIGSYLLPAVLAQLHRKHPRVALEMRIGNTQEIQDALRAGVVDIGLTEGLAEADDLESQVFYTDELVAIMPKEHHLAVTANKTTTSDGGLPIVLASQLVLEPFVMREVGSGTRAVLEQALTRKGLPLPTIAMTLASTEAIVRVVKAGAGVAVVSRLALETDGTYTGDGDNANAAHTIGDVDLRRPLHLSRLRGAFEGIAVRAFLVVLRRTLRGMPQAPSENESHEA